MLATDPRPPRVIHVCEDLACKCVGSDDLIAQLEERFGPEGDLSDDGSATWFRSPCLGQCDRAPAALVTVASSTEPEEHVLAPATAGDVLAALAGDDVAGDPVTTLAQTDDSLRLLARVGRVDPVNLDAYRASGGYETLRLAVELGPEGIIREVKDSKLMGRGGAAFPTGVKWEAVARQPARPHYLICNADESEPGTFKDRVVIEGDPFSLIESMTIAGYATGCEHGYVYLRGEYPMAHHILGQALDEARRRGYLGADVLGEGFAFDIEIRKGAGAYICGEETAIFNSIEGFRGEPRNKPPFPVVAGLFGKPTVINNVISLASVPVIMDRGAAFYKDFGMGRSRGTIPVQIAGNVRNGGLFEAAFGLTLGEIVDDIGGGTASGRPVKAVQVGGPLGAYFPRALFDTPFDYEAFAAKDGLIGHAGIVVFDDSADMLKQARFAMEFCAIESCGKCTPCRIGSTRGVEVVDRIAKNIEPQKQIELLTDLCNTMKFGSLCALGGFTPYPVMSALTHFPEDFRPSPVVEAAE
jgi:formate dehydrogenase iron-sulfur subunit